MLEAIPGKNLFHANQPFWDIVENSEQLLAHYKSEYKFVPKPLGELLIEAGIVSAEQIKKAIFDGNRVANERIGETLRRHGLVTEEDIGHALGRRFGVPFVKLRDFDFDRSAVRCLPVSFARKHCVVPLVLDGTKLIVAVSDPTDSELINMLRFVTDKVPEIAVSTSDEILLAIGECYGQDEVNTALEHLEVLKQVDPYENLQTESDPVAEKPVVQLVHNLIVDAVVNRASDIHIRPRQNSVDVYFRIDGMLIKQRSFSKPLLPTISTRIKILGNMDISEHRLPQDGRSRIRYSNKEIDLRISVMPGIYGEDVVIRLLDTQFAMKRLEDLGYEGNDAEQIRHLLTRNNGLFLVTGPTGSGKSTTLYTALDQIRNQNVNIVTVEDPVEYHIDGITQIQINQQTGYTFARALRHILRHDPDVIMVGEIRDQETAKMAVESALTGHLVLSTLHTNSAATTVTRLLEIGIEPYLVSSTLLAVLAQRLVRCNCKHCLVEEAVEPAMRTVLGLAQAEQFYKGAGCDKCNHTGVKGRHAVYELLTMTPAIREMLAPGINAVTLQKRAVEDGMTPLTTHALHLARQKIISLAEVYRIRLE